MRGSLGGVQLLQKSVVEANGLSLADPCFASPGLLDLGFYKNPEQLSSVSAIEKMPI